MEEIRQTMNGVPDADIGPIDAYVSPEVLAAQNGEQIEFGTTLVQVDDNENA